jgi:hypothetical protein
VMVRSYSFNSLDAGDLAFILHPKFRDFLASPRRSVLTQMARRRSGFPSSKERNKEYEHGHDQQHEGNRSEDKAYSVVDSQ